MRTGAGIERPQLAEGEGGEEKGREEAGGEEERGRRKLFILQKKAQKLINETLYKKQVILLKSQLNLSTNCLQQSKYSKRGNRVEKLFAV